jgi:hypothetical protein
MRNWKDIYHPQCSQLSQLVMATAKLIITQQVVLLNKCSQCITRPRVVETAIREEQVGAPTVPSAVIRGSNNLKTFSVTNMSKCHMMSQCVTSISFLS